MGRTDPRANVKSGEKDTPQQEGKEVQDPKEREVNNEGREREQSDRDPKGREGTAERGPRPTYSFWPKQGSGQGERTIHLGQAPDATQDQYNRPREERKEAFKEIREKLEAEKDTEVRGVLKCRKKIHDMKKKSRPGLRGRIQTGTHGIAGEG